MVALPAATPETVRVSPDTDTVATSASLEVAVTSCVSPLSLSVTLAVVVTVDPRDTVTSEIGPTTGWLFGTETPNPTASAAAFGASLSSCAPTVIVAAPRDTAVTVSVFPDTDTVATSSSLDSAVTVCVSPASPSVTSTITGTVIGGSRGTVTSEMLPITG